MIYSEYGQTGKKVSAVGFGGMRFDESKSNEENAELLIYAYEKGINYFDTAPGYSSDRSEDIYGIGLSKLKGTFYVTSKAMPTKVDTSEKAIEAVKKSLERLKVDKINFYHVWCIRNMDHYSLAMRPGGQYEGLLKCKEEGLIEHIVFSSHQPGDQVKQVLDDGMFEGVLLGMNILNFPYRWDGVSYAYKNKYGVVAMNPLSGGMIPQHEEQLGYLTENNESATEAALRFNISCPEITVTLNGFTTREQIDMACRIADESKPFTEEDINKIRAKLGTNMNSVCTACGYCKDCPVGIPIPSYMQHYNEKQIFSADDDALKNILKFSHEWGLLASNSVRAKACIECGKCERDCTQHLPIIERLKYLNKLDS